MSYNFKRALGIALAFYVANFVVGIIAGLISGQDMSSMNTISDSFWYLGMVAAVVLTAIFTMWYFRNPSIKPSAKNGFYFGLTSVIVAFILDFVFLALGNAGGGNFDMTEYYSDYRFWIIVVLALLTAKLVGYKLGSKDPVNPV